MPKKTSLKKTSPAKEIEPIVKPAIYKKKRDIPAVIKREEKSSVGVIFLSIIAIIIALGFAGYFVYINFLSTESQKQKELANLENYQVPMGITVPNETPAQQEDPLASWLTYGLVEVTTSSTDDNATTTINSTNTKPFSFRYPPNFKIDESDKSLRLFSDEIPDVQMLINWTATTKDLDQYVGELDIASKTAWEGKPSIEITTSTNDAIIANLPAIVRQQKMLAADLEQFVVYLKNDDRLYTISLSAPQLDSNLGQFFAVFLKNFSLVK